MKNLISTTLLGVTAASLILTGLAVPANASASLSLVSQVSTVTDVNDASKTELLQRINNYRAANGLQPVSINTNLTNVAQAWSDKTASAGTFKHNPDFSTQIPQNWKYTAEIIGVNDSPEGIMLGWINSEEHNNVLLEPRATEIGLGYAYQGNPAGEYVGNYYATAVFANYATVTPVKISVTPVAPVWKTASFDIPAVTGIQYKVNGVVHPAGAYSGQTVTTVTAEALDGYAITGTASWTHTYENVIIDPSPSVEIVTPAQPTFAATTYTIPSVVGVQYKVNGTVQTPGTHPGSGIISITAEALQGFNLTGTASWSKDYSIIVNEPLPTVETVTPATPIFSTTQYTIPATTGVQYKVNGTTKAAGSYLGTGTITITATALPGYSINGIASWSKTFIVQPAPNPAIKTLGDIVAIDSTGNLWNYGSLKSPRKKIGTGWLSFIDIHTVDWNKDGVIDIIAKTTAGELYVFKGTSTGSFTKTKLGSGWKNYTLDVVQWNKQLKYPSIIATDAITGKLFHYANPSGTGISSQSLIGSGWRGLAINAIDWDKDGNIDLIVKNSAGQLVLYRTNGAGKFINEKRAVIGGGWNAFNSIKVVKNFGGAGTTGLLVRNSAGSLIYYQANKSAWAKPRAIGSGWQAYNIANQ